jgi:hypothetical protein
LVKNGTVHTLKLFQTAMKDDCSCIVAEMLRHSSSITTLVINGSMIGFAGAEALAEAFEVNTILSTLDMSKNQIGDDGPEAFATTMKTSPSPRFTGTFFTRAYAHD